MPRFLLLKLRPFRTLDLYLSGQFWSSFVFLTLVFLVFVLGNFVLFNLMNFILEKQAPAEAALQIVLFQVPAFAVYAFPLSALASCLFCVSRMSKDSEMDVLRTSGVGFFRLLAPFLLFGAMVSGGSFLLIEKVVPAANRMSQDIWRQFLVSDVADRFKPQVFLEGKSGKRLYFSSIDKEKRALTGIVVYDAENDEYPMRIQAKTGSWDDRFLILKDGRVNKYDEDGELAAEASFRLMRFNIEREVERIFGVERAAQELTLRELRERIARQKAGGVDSSRSETDFHFKMSIPAAALVCVVLAFPLSLKTGRSGMFAGLLLCLVLVALYYVGTIGFQALGWKGILPPWVAAWLQNLVFAGVGVVLLLFSRK